MDVKRINIPMRLSDFLVEATHHPLPKGVNRWAESQYAAFVVVMHPRDFLYLTTEDQAEYDRIMDKADVSLDDFRKGTNPERHKNSYALPPFLDVYWPSGRVKQHEGRHRAARVLKAGGNKFTCYVHFMTDKKYEVTWEVLDFDNMDADRETQKRVFDTTEEARNFERELYGPLHQENARIINTNIKTNATSSFKMKGGPDSEGWDYKPWLMEHMPPYFIGQFVDWRRVPTSRMRFAPMKSFVNRQR